MHQSLIIDLTEQMMLYRRTAPSPLLNYINFNDFVSIIINTESAPFYSEVVTESLVNLMSDKMKSDEEMEAIELDMLEIYIDSYTSYIDTHLENMIKIFCGYVEYDKYLISSWIDNKTPILLVKASDYG